MPGLSGPARLPAGDEWIGRCHGGEAALALGCTIHENSIFARKNYFYPDLPKGYQISQYDQPFSTKGHLDIELDGQVKRVGITRVPWKRTPERTCTAWAAARSWISTAPECRSSRSSVSLICARARKRQRTCKRLRDILVFIGVNDGNLEEGSFRCDANVSLRPRGETKFGTRCELKNINSFRFVQRAIDAEIARQTAILDAGGKINQETRSFDPDTGQTHTLRSKEDAHDYRYFPEPDLPPLKLDGSFVARAQQSWVSSRSRCGSATSRARPDSGGGGDADSTSGVRALLRGACATFSQPVKVANWVVNEVLRGASTHGLDAKFSVTPVQVAELLALVETGDISGKQAKKVYAAIEGTEKSPKAVVEERGMKVVSNASELQAICERVLAQNPSPGGELPRREEGRSRLFGRAGDEGDQGARPIRSS